MAGCPAVKQHGCSDGSLAITTQTCQGLGLALARSSIDYADHKVGAEALLGQIGYHARSDLLVEVLGTLLLLTLAAVVLLHGLLRVLCVPVIVPARPAKQLFLGGYPWALLHTDQDDSTDVYFSPQVFSHKCIWTSACRMQQGCGLWGSQQSLAVSHTGQDSPCNSKSTDLLQPLAISLGITSVLVCPRKPTPSSSAHKLGRHFMRGKGCIFDDLSRPLSDSSNSKCIEMTVSMTPCHDLSCTVSLEAAVAVASRTGSQYTCAEPSCAPPGCLKGAALPCRAPWSCWLSANARRLLINATHANACAALARAACLALSQRLGHYATSCS